MGVVATISSSRVMISADSCSNAARGTTPPGRAWPMRAPRQSASVARGVPGWMKAYLSMTSSPRFGWKAGASVLEGVKVDVSQASPAIAITGRSRMVRAARGTVNNEQVVRKATGYT